MKQEESENQKHYSNNQERNKQHFNQKEPISNNNSISRITLGKETNTNIRSTLNKDYDKDIGKINSSKVILNKENKRIQSNNVKLAIKNTQIVFSTIVNKIGSHNSYLGVTIHSIYHMTLFRDYIIKDLEDRYLWSYPLLTYLKSILIKYSQNKRIDISELSCALSEQFYEKSMFTIDKPDDCSDCLFAFINMIHSLYINCPLNTTSNLSCNTSCFAHRLFWLDITKIDECECTSANQTPCSIHNYITDIPLVIILQYIKQKGLYESNQKLFNMYHHIIQNTKVLCPLNGLNCNFCSTKRILFANKSLPPYLLFSYERLSVSQWSTSDILKSMFVIPKYYDFGFLFCSSSNQKDIYELFGFVFIKNNKSYSCAFKNNNEKETNASMNINWVYYNDDNVYTLSSLIDLISLCLKNSLLPVLFYYQLIQFPSNTKLSLSPYCSMDECRVLEKYALVIDNYQLPKARFRPFEALFNKDNEIKRNTSHRKMHSHIIRNPSKNKKRVDDDNDDDELSEYICLNCKNKNRIECILCPNCGESNEKAIENTIKRRQKVINLPFAKNTNVTISQAKPIGIPRGKEANSPSVPAKSSSNSNNNNNMPSDEIKGNFNHNTNLYNDKQQIKKLIENKIYDLPKQMNPKNAPSLTNYNTNPQIGDKQLDSQMDHLKMKSNEVKLKQPNKFISPNNQKASIQQINISDSTSLLLENRIKAYVGTKNKDSNSNNNSNYLINNNSKERPSTKPQIATQKPIILPEMWICANCEKVNKANGYKCLVCGLINKKQKDLIAQNEKQINKSQDANFTPSSPEMNLSNQQPQLTAPSHAINLNTTFKTVSCACFSNHQANMIKNGICDICHRVIDSSSQTNDTDKEQKYKYARNVTKDNKAKENNISSEMVMKIQNSKKPITAQYRYENEETVNSSMIKNIKVSKETGFKKKLSDQKYKKISQKKK